MLHSSLIALFFFFSFVCFSQQITPPAQYSYIVGILDSNGLKIPLGNSKGERYEKYTLIDIEQHVARIPRICVPKKAYIGKRVIVSGRMIGKEIWGIQKTLYFLPSHRSVSETFLDADTDIEKRYSLTNKAGDLDVFFSTRPFVH